MSKYFVVKYEELVGGTWIKQEGGCDLIKLAEIKAAKLKQNSNRFRNVRIVSI